MQKIIRTSTCHLGSYYSCLVPETGFEPVRCFHRGILSPLRLPVSPLRRFFGGATQIRTGGKGFADPCLTTWLWRLHLLGKPRNKKMERETRFELATFALARQRSTTEPFPHIKTNIGGNNRARTYDPLLVRQMLSQLSYAPATRFC